jgi:hypothetical protein
MTDLGNCRHFDFAQCRLSAQDDAQEEWSQI